LYDALQTEFSLFTSGLLAREIEQLVKLLPNRWTDHGRFLRPGRTVSATHTRWYSAYDAARAAPGRAGDGAGQAVWGVRGVASATIR
jgi:hypothetical protein